MRTKLIKLLTALGEKTPEDGWPQEMHSLFEQGAALLDENFNSQTLEDFRSEVRTLDIRKISRANLTPDLINEPWWFIIKANNLLFDITDSLKMRLARWKKDSNPGLFSSRPAEFKEIDLKVVALQRAMDSGNDYVIKARIAELQNALNKVSERKDDFLETEPPAIRKVAFNMLNHFVNKAAGYSYRLMSDGNGDPKINEIVFYISDDNIVAKIQGEKDFSIPKHNPIYGIIMAANLREGAKNFTPKEVQQLSQNTLLKSYPPNFKNIMPTTTDKLLLELSNWPQTSFVPYSIRPFAFRKIDKKIKEIEISIKNGASAKALADAKLLLGNIAQLKITSIARKRRDALESLEQVLIETLSAKDVLPSLLDTLSDTTEKQLQQPEFMVNATRQFKTLLNDQALRPTLKELAETERKLVKKHPDMQFPLTNAFGVFFSSFGSQIKNIAFEIPLNAFPEQKQAEQYRRMFFCSELHNAYKQDERGKNLLEQINFDLFVQDPIKLANLEKGLFATIDYLKEMAGNLDEKNDKQLMEFSILVRFVHCVYGHIFDRNKALGSTISEQARDATTIGPEDPQKGPIAPIIDALRLGDKKSRCHNRKPSVSRSNSDSDTKPLLTTPK